jgi:hypothetical protein
MDCDCSVLVSSRAPASFTVGKSSEPERLNTTSILYILVPKLLMRSTDSDPSHRRPRPKPPSF